MYTQILDTPLNAGQDINRHRVLV